MRLIDGNRLAKETMPQYKELMGTDIGHGMGMMLAEINAAPTIDAVPVVRCKDCKHWSRDGNGYGDDESHCTNPDGLDNYARADDFCSYGERKDGEG